MISMLPSACRARKRHLGNLILSYFPWEKNIKYYLNFLNSRAGGGEASGNETLNSRGNSLNKNYFGSFCSQSKRHVAKACLQISLIAAKLKLMPCTSTEQTVFQLWILCRSRVFDYECVEWGEMNMQIIRENLQCSRCENLAIETRRTSLH